MKNLDEILENVTSVGRWDCGIVSPGHIVLLDTADKTRWKTLTQTDAAYASRAARNFPELVRALESHLRSSEEFSRHAMYPHPDCSEQKKLAFIRADIKMKESSRQAHAALTEALND